MRDISEITKKKCEFKGCKDNADSIIRTRFLCHKHYKIIREDNKKRMNENEKITKGLNILELTKFKLGI